ncbi:unnamed protein product, partial [Ectocarpus sp. 13 AM-2016]
CTGLTQLNLSGCLGICGPGLAAVGECCPKLVHLDLLKGCDGVTDVGLAWMSSGCPALEYLDLSGCVKVCKARLVGL